MDVWIWKLVVWKGKKNKRIQSILAGWSNRSSRGRGAPNTGVRAGKVPGKGLQRKSCNQHPRQEIHRNIGDDWRRQDVKNVSPSIGAPNCPVQKGPGELVFPNLELHVCSVILPTRMGGTQGRSRSDRVRRRNMFPNSMLRHPKISGGTSPLRVQDRNGTLASEQIWAKRGPQRQMQN